SFEIVRYSVEEDQLQAFAFVRRLELACLLPGLRALLHCHSDLLDSVITRISTFGPVVFGLFRGIRNLRDGLHILQTKFYGHQQTEWCSMIHSQGLTVEVRGEQRLWMAGRRQVD